MGGEKGGGVRREINSKERQGMRRCQVWRELRREAYTGLQPFANSAHNAIPMGFLEKISKSVQPHSLSLVNGGETRRTRTRVYHLSKPRRTAVQGRFKVKGRYETLAHSWPFPRFGSGKYEIPRRIVLLTKLRGVLYTQELPLLLGIYNAKLFHAYLLEIG